MLNSLFYVPSEVLEACWHAENLIRSKSWRWPLLVCTQGFLCILWLTSWPSIHPFPFYASVSTFSRQIIRTLQHKSSTLSHNKQTCGASSSSNGSLSHPFSLYFQRQIKPAYVLSSMNLAFFQNKQCNRQLRGASLDIQWFTILRLISTFYRQIQQLRTLKHKSDFSLHTQPCLKHFDFYERV